MGDFINNRRQIYIDEESYRNTVAHYAAEAKQYPIRLQEPEHIKGSHTTMLRFMAGDLWRVFQLRYTAGERLDALAMSLDEIVKAFQRYVDKTDEASDEDYEPPFRMVDKIETYQTYLHLASTCILLHREDLLPAILSWNDGTDYDGIDAVIEELLKFYFPERPGVDEWLYAQPYQLLLDVIDEPDEAERPKLMKKYVRKWYPAMKGQARFWGIHEEITSEFSPYVGYWAMCAGAFTYLYNIDDSSYRNEIVYPKDLVDYARSMVRSPITLATGETILRTIGGHPCPRAGRWFSPAKPDSERQFNAGDIMPSFDFSEFGTTIWQWRGE